MAAFGIASGVCAKPGSITLDDHGRQVVDVATLAPTEGFLILGDADADGAGCSVSAAGDINGDGYDDLIVGASGNDDGGTYAGSAYVIFGSERGRGEVADGQLIVELGSLAPRQGFAIVGEAPDDLLVGGSVSQAGDVNGDGFDDLIIGAAGSNAGRHYAGKAYVVFGAEDGFGTLVGGNIVLDLTTLSPDDGFVVLGATRNDYAGYGVSSAGDVNGDGFDDVIVGAIGGDDAVIFGSATGFGTTVDGRQVVDLATLSPRDGFILQGERGDNSGINVSAAGDVNGDGFDDVLIGANQGNDGGTDAGQGYVVFGSASGIGTIQRGRLVFDLTSPSAAEGCVIQGDAAGDFAGFGISSAGDINGDGFDDIIVGAPKGDDGGDNAGEAYVIFGTASGFGRTDSSGRQVLDLTSLSAAEGFVIRGDKEGDQTGWSVSSAGDVNGDGFDDIIVGALFGDDGAKNSGEAYVVFGSASGFGTTDSSGRQVIDLTSLSPSEGFVIQGDLRNGLCGINVSAAGDVNGDGYDDLIVGADGGGKLAGEAIVIYGGPSASDDPLTLVGTVARDVLTGGLGDDVLYGICGRDAINGGAGDDLIVVRELNFRDIDGGSGTDTLVVRGVGVIDFTTLSDNRVSGIEALDLSGAGDDTVVIGATDLFHLSDTPNADFTGAESHQNLVVYGDAGDVLELAGGDPDGRGPADAYEWELVGRNDDLDGSERGTFDVYNLTLDGEVLASVAVDADMNVILV